MSKRFFQVIFLLLVTSLITTCQSATPGGVDLRDKVRKFTLNNGMTFLLLKRDVAPVFSVQLKVKVGNIEEDPGASGLAHFFEHMAFKGTTLIGSKDFSKEQPLLDQVLAVGTQIADMKAAGKSPEVYADFVVKRKTLEAEENKFIEKNEYVRIFQKNGGRDLNATTSNDFTTYYVSMPSSKIELWAYMESERLKNRIFREFFTEVDVVSEERRMRIDNSPDGRLYEAFTGAAFDKSPYKIHPIGYAEDIQHYTPAKAMDFYSRYYIPSRMVAVLVGNFDLDQTESIMRKYFSHLPKKDDHPKMIPTQVFDATFPRSVTITDESSPPRVYFGYHRPAHPHPDDIVLDVLQDILCDGRTSRLYKRLVLKDRSVPNISCYASIPGARLDSVFMFMAAPLGSHTNKEVQDAIVDEIHKLKETGPTEEELEIVKNKHDADLIYSLESNDGLAATLAFYESLTGDWQYMYYAQKRIHEVTPQDIQRVVGAYFVPEREVSAYLEQKKAKE